MQIDWGKHVLPHFRKAWHSQKRFVVLKGGAGSGKSVVCCQKTLYRAMTQERARLICTRKFGTTVRKSVWKMLKIMAHDLGCQDKFNWNETSMTATYGPADSEIICYGLDDVEKIKSIPNITGFWHEEPTELMPGDLDQCDLRMRGRNHYFQHLLSFNPISETNYLKARFFDSTDPDALLDHSTYLDNPHNGPEYHDRMEYYRINDPDYYKVYGLGEWGVLQGLIYRIWPEAKLPEFPDDTYYGLDFGFSHETALVRVDEFDGDYYVHQLIYDSGLTEVDLVERMRELVPNVNTPIYADPAQPGAIQMIRDAGFNIWKADKSQNSVLAGIMKLRGLRISVTPESPKIKTENRSYKWRVRSDGVTLQEPEKSHDHAMDAIRYAIYTHGKRFIEVCSNR